MLSYSIRDTFIHQRWHPVKLFPSVRRWYEPGYTVYPRGDMDLVSWSSPQNQSYTGSNVKRSFANPNHKWDM